MNPVELASQTASFGLTPTANSIMGKDDFLRILVTQLQNQDPINPMKGEEFAVQLAQFSSVEQLQNINSNLESVMELDLNLNQALNNTMATTFIGKGVRALGHRVMLEDGESVNLHYQLSQPTADATIKIRDSAGTLVRTITVGSEPAGHRQFEWDGKDENGDALAPGQYTFRVSAQDSNGNPVAVQPMIVGTVDSIRYQGGRAILLLGDLEVELGDVLEIGMNGETASDE